MTADSYPTIILRILLIFVDNFVIIRKRRCVHKQTTKVIHKHKVFKIMITVYLTSVQFTEVEVSYKSKYDALKYSLVENLITNVYLVLEQFDHLTPKITHLNVDFKFKTIFSYCPTTLISFP